MKMKAWFSALRLRTLPLALSCVITGSAIAFHQGKFSWDICILTATTTILLQILSNLANDFGDAVKGTDNDDRIGPARAVQTGAITANAMRRAIVICAVLCLISGIWLLLISLDPNWIFYLFLGLGLVGIAAAIKYTVGKRAYGYRGMGDVFVFIFFGLVGVLGTIFLQTQEFRWIDAIPAACIGLLSAGVLNLNNMRDHKNDEKSNKRTLVVAIGYKAAKNYHLLITIPPIILLIAYVLLIAPGLMAALLIIPLTFLILAIVRVYKTKDESSLDPELKKLALTTFLSAVLLAINLCVSL